MRFMKDIVLKIFLAPSRQWAGSIMDGETDIGGISGCSTPEEVEEAALDAGFLFDYVETL